MLNGKPASRSFLHDAEYIRFNLEMAFHHARSQFPLRGGQVRFQISLTYLRLK